MTVALDAFRYNIARVRDLRALHSALSMQTTPVVDLSDLLRATYVLSVSALDHYVHELARNGMMEIFDGLRPATDAYKRFRLSMQSVIGAVSIMDARGNIESDIRTQHSYLAFQKPEKIADAVRLFSDVALWDAVGVELAMPTKQVKDRLTLIVDRRNKIAHESDIDPTYPNSRWPIAGEDVESVSDFLESVVIALDKHTQ